MSLEMKMSSEQLPLDKDLSHEELPLMRINDVESGKTSSFLAYHGSDRPFISAIPSEKFPVVFYAETPEIASTYPFGYYRNQLIKTGWDIESNNTKYSREDLILGAKLLLTQEQNHSPEWTAIPNKKPPIDSRRLNEYHMKSPDIITLQEKLENDSDFHRESEKLLSS